MSNYCEYIEKMLRTASNLTSRFIIFHFKFAKKYMNEIKKEIKDIHKNDEK